MQADLYKGRKTVVVVVIDILCGAVAETITEVC